MGSHGLSLLATISSTVLFVLALGGLVFVAIRSRRREAKLYRELDAEIPRVAERANRLHEKKFGKRNTKLNIIVSESFSSPARRAKLP